MGQYFDGIKVGDRVWSCVYGWGEVTDITDGVRPIEATFNSLRGFFYFDGKWDKDELQTLFWDEVKITPPPKPKRMVKKEAQVKIEWERSVCLIKIRQISGDVLLDKSDIQIGTLTWEEEE